MKTISITLSFSFNAEDLLKRIQILPPNFRILRGDSRQEHPTPQLFKVKGKQIPVTVQQKAMAWNYFNSREVFVVLLQEIVFVWIGRAANSIEKLQATMVSGVPSVVW